MKRDILQTKEQNPIPGISGLSPLKFWLELFRNLILMCYFLVRVCFNEFMLAINFIYVYFVNSNCKSHKNIRIQNCLWGLINLEIVLLAHSTDGDGVRTYDRTACMYVAHEKKAEKRHTKFIILSRSCHVSLSPSLSLSLSLSLFLSLSDPHSLSRWNMEGKACM